MTRRLHTLVAAALGTGVLTALLLAFVLGGVAMPMHLSGVGALNLASDEMSGSTFNLTPTIDPHSNPQGGPQPAVVANLPGNAAVDHLVMEKAFDLGTIGDTDLGTWKVRIDATSDAISASNLRIAATHICSSDGTFHGLEAGSLGGYQELEDAMWMNADEFAIADVRAVATTMEAGSISLPGLDVRVIPGDYDDELFGGGSCLTDEG